MGKIIFSQNQFCIQEVYSGQKKGYIVFNSNKNYQEGHSHLNNLKAAKYVLFLAEKEKLPNDLDSYRMMSLYRILEDGPFREKVLNLINVKEQKSKKKYINVCVKETQNRKTLR